MNQTVDDTSHKKELKFEENNFIKRTKNLNLNTDGDDDVKTSLQPCKRIIRLPRFNYKRKSRYTPYNSNILADRFENLSLNKSSPKSVKKLKTIFVESKPSSNSEPLFQQSCKSINFKILSERINKVTITKKEEIKKCNSNNFQLSSRNDGENKIQQKDSKISPKTSPCMTSKHSPHAVIDDMNVLELTYYMENYFHLPKEMSIMAEMMYA